MDVEALQAQIDLSNSIAYDLVSSWVKPSTSSTTSVSHTISRELEEYAKRPPRLGLGATVSQSSLATSRAAARLKGKLVGKKRRRDERNDYSLTTGACEPHDTQDEEDEGESRSAAILTKKSRAKRSSGKEPQDIPITKETSTAGHSHHVLSTSHPANSGKEPQDRKLPITLKETSAEGESNNVLSTSHQANSPVSSQSAPLLNLHCPPLVQVGDEMVAHPQEQGTNPKKKKKRRRRQGKGRKGGGSEVAG